MSWFLAPSLVALRDEVNARWPNRDKSSDGAVGDTRHSAIKSSHNPLWSAPGKWSGVVRAVDIDGNGKVGERTPLVAAILDATIGDPRVWYVIWNRQIWSRTTDWKPKPYSGLNAHDKHVHVSLVEEQSAWADTSRWLEVLVKIPTYKPLAVADAVFWNMNNGARPGVRNALEAINKSGARVIALNECSGHWPVLRDFAKDRGFTVITGKGELGTASGILARHRSGHEGHGVQTVRVPWTGPQGKAIAGRTLLYEKAIVEGRRIMTVDLHQVWGPNRDSNDEAKRAVVEHVRRWAEKNPTWDLFIGPDHNESRTSTAPFSPLGTANAIGGRILAGGSGPDYIIYRPAIVTPDGARPALPRVAVGPDLDSDHHSLRVNY